MRDQNLLNVLNKYWPQIIFLLGLIYEIASLIAKVDYIELRTARIETKIDALTVPGIGATK